MIKFFFVIVALKCDYAGKLNKRDFNFNVCYKSFPNEFAKYVLK